MNYYRRKPVIIEAFQYLPDSDGNFVCPDWFNSDEIMISRPPCVRCLMIPGQTAFRDDWVIRNANGTLTVCHDDFFHENYEGDFSIRG
jgi:hypothetical protein